MIDISGYAAAVIDDDGEILWLGSREQCEEMAQMMSRIYCWIDKGRLVQRADYREAA